MSQDYPSFLSNLEQNRRLTPDKIAVARVFEDSIDQLTYAQLWKSSTEFAARLQSLCKQGDRAIILAETGNEFIIAFIGCLLAGVVAVPCTPTTPNKSARLKNIISDCDAKVFIAAEASIKKYMPFLEEIQVWVTTADLSSDKTYSLPIFQESDNAFLQYTSGTTSSPKGVIVTFGNLLANVKMIQERFEFDADLIMVSWLPFYHDMGLVGMIISPLHEGGTTYFLAPNEFLQRPVRWLKVMTEFKATCTGVPNFALELSLSRSSPENKVGIDLSSLKTLFCGSEPIRYQSVKDFTDHFADCGLRGNALFPCYGMAELALFASAGKVLQPLMAHSFDVFKLMDNEIVELPHGEPGSRRLVGCGTAAINSQIAIVNPHTKRRISDGVGEIWISGKHLSKGYWNRPELTEETFRAQLEDEGDNYYLRTGDLGFFYQGELYISGRLKELIIIGGRNIHPSDVEACIVERIEEAREGKCAAFSAMIDDRESLVLFIELDRQKFYEMERFNNKPGIEKDPHVYERIVQFYKTIQSSISSQFGIVATDIFAFPRGRVPVTTSGKVKRLECANLFHMGQAGGLSLIDLMGGYQKSAAS